MVNRFQRHLYILPEDDANRQVANGFVKSITGRNIQTLPEAGGWRVLLERFKSDYVKVLERNQNAHIVLVIDFDGQTERRLDTVLREIPEELRDRVFVIGALTNPEEVRKQLGSFETIGAGLARDCRDHTNVFWDHDLLSHNAAEVQRFRQSIGDVLFS